jgi:hypothetical protein
VKELPGMKHIVLLSTILVALIFSARAAEPSANVKEAVLKAEKDWKAAVLKGDRVALEKLISDELSYTHSSAKTQNKEQFIQDATGGATVYKSIEFDNTRLRQYGDVVVITQTAVIVTIQTGTTHLYLTEVWAREAGNWQMVSRQATKLP